MLIVPKGCTTLFLAVFGGQDKVETAYSSSFEKLTEDQQEKLKKVIENS